MRADVAAALSKSAVIFRDRVWPLIGEACGGGQLIPVELVTESRFAKDLDALAGIDAWQILRPFGMRGLASRVQYTDQPWRTFTIRASLASGYETELHKRLRAIQHGYLYPHFTVQAYVRGRAGRAAPPDGRVLAVGITHTRELFGEIREWIERYREVPDSDLWKRRDGIWLKTGPDGNRFICVDWASYRRADHWLWTYELPTTWVDSA
jgi:hypothetical protein